MTRQLTGLVTACSSELTVSARRGIGSSAFHLLKLCEMGDLWANLAIGIFPATNHGSDGFPDVHVTRVSQEQCAGNHSIDMAK